MVTLVSNPCLMGSDLEARPFIVSYDTRYSRDGKRSSLPRGVYTTDQSKGRPLVIYSRDSSRRWTCSRRFTSVGTESESQSSASRRKGIARARSSVCPARPESDEGRELDLCRDRRLAAIPYRFIPFCLMRRSPLEEMADTRRDYFPACGDNGNFGLGEDRFTRSRNSLLCITLRMVSQPFFVLSSHSRVDCILYR